MFLADTKLRPRKTTITIKTIPNGPFKGRMYVVNPDGSLGRRVKMLSDGKVTPWRTSMQ